MGLRIGSDYTEKKIREAIIDATGARTVEMDFSGPNVKLTVDGHAVKGKHGRTGDKITWSQMLITEVSAVAPQQASASKFEQA